MARTPTSEQNVLMRGGETVHAVRVRAPARLHLGFLDLEGSLGRRYGGIGLAVDRPQTDVAVSRAPVFSARGVERERALRLVEGLAPALALDQAYAVDVERAIPAHAGLGSGTQLALAIAAGILALEGRTSTAGAIASLADRGARSAIGMGAFEAGGFIVDGGRDATDRPPPVVARLPFPESWRVLLVLDRAAEGVHGDRETRAFRDLRPFPAALAGHLCRLTLMRLLPAVAEQNIAPFGAAVTEIQAAAGAHFAAAQGGGPWSSPAVGRLVEKLGAMGAIGLGQSSWGPTGFAFAGSEDAARRLYETAAEEARAEGLEIVIARGRNSGARTDLITAAKETT